MLGSTVAGLVAGRESQCPGVKGSTLRGVSDAAPTPEMKWPRDTGAWRSTIHHLGEAHSVGRSMGGAPSTSACVRQFWSSTLIGCTTYEDVCVSLAASTRIKGGSP